MDPDFAITLAGYTVIEQIGQTHYSTVYRAVRAGEKHPVIIKVLNIQNPTPAQIARYRHEYELIRGVDINGIIKTIDFIEHTGTLALVLEDFGGVSLKKIIPDGFTLERFLDLAIRLADILGMLHQSNISHHDIKPHNILLNVETDTLKITDFGIASEIIQQSVEMVNPIVMEGTLAYISPEQTGRMNCPVDYRTDLYSLGITFYEMLTGLVPFRSKDAMEIIHAHIAKMPAPPIKLNPEIPGPVSEIVMKLLSKSAGDRYQNSFGLAADLRKCQSQLATNGRIEPFLLGVQDISLRFIIPQNLVGREAQLATLDAAFDRVSQGAVEVVLVTGEPGIGKSALINEMSKPIVKKRGYFISGKYDQFHRGVPYSAMIQAFQGMARQLLAENDEHLREWKKRLTAAMGPNGKIITDVIGEIELIIGKQPDVPELGPKETQNRFNLVFRNFVRVFVNPSHPLVLFLDDLQWIDQASLNLIQTITMDRELGFLLFIGSYRDTEVAAHHPLMLTRDAIGTIDLPINTIHLDALSPEDINELIASFLRCAPDASLPLARIMHAKTKGSPFFVNQFLKTLYDQHYLTLDLTKGWIWDIQKIRELQVTENVVQFMADKLHDLSASPLEIIKTCACIGNRFDLETLASVEDRPLGEILFLIDALIQEGLISRQGNLYRFYHDRIQEAAYSLMTPADRERMHYSIGNLDLKRTSPEQLFSRIFYICDQLNRAHRLVSTPEERTQLAELNLKAGLKAKESTAYAAAVSYLAMGIKLLDSDVWQTHYSLAYAIYSEQMKCHYLHRNFDEAEKLFDIVIAHALTKKDKAKAYNTMVVLYTNMRSPEDAVELGLKALSLFDIRISPDISKAALIIDLIKVRRLLRGLTVEKISDLPNVKDEDMLACLQLISSVATPAYYVNQNLFAKLAFKAIDLGLKYGCNTPYLSGSIIAVATIVQTGLGDYELAYRLGEMALKLNERFVNSNIGGMVHHAFAFFIQHWTKHARHDIDIYRKGYQLSLNNGDFTYAGHSINASTDCRLMVGMRLTDVLEESNKYRELMSIVKDPFIAARYRENNRLILTLQGQTDNRYALCGSGYDEDAYIRQLHKEKNFFGLCYTLLYRLKLSYLYGKYDEARQAAAELDKYISVQMGTEIVAEHYFYYSLTLAALASAGKSKPLLNRVILRRNQRKMLAWAGRCEENFRHKYDLVAAEIMAGKGRYKEAQALYHQAIEGARQNDYLPEEALACERLALLYLGCESKDEAGLFMQRAVQCYMSWGANAKEQDLRERYSHLLREDKKSRQTNINGYTTSSDSASRTLDLATVMQVSQVISSEIRLESLLQQTMHMAITNAGAQRGYLILESDGRLRVLASEDVDTGVNLENIPLDACDGLSTAIVNYVYHSGENLLLGNAVSEGAFRNDPHILKNQCKSILCLPILNKGQLMGILYMENNLTADAFTPERLEILRIISAQAAISLRNAQLYENITMEISVRKQAEEALIESYKKVQEARVATILGLAKLAEYRDEATGAHLERIREYARIIAQELSKKPKYQGYITPDYIDDIFNSAILHDIGKVGVPDAILLKPGKLDQEEFEVIKTHTTLGGDALRAVEAKIEGQSFLTLGKEIAYYHHEKWDGSGYPKGLAGNDIPLSARIVALADVYDALTSKRIYKEAFAHEQAMEIILNDRGTHFAPDVVDAFVTHAEDFRRIREELLGE